MDADREGGSREEIELLETFFDRPLRISFEPDRQTRRFCNATRDDQYGDGMACFLSAGHEPQHVWTRYAALPEGHPNRKTPCYHPRSCERCARSGRACGRHHVSDAGHDRCTGTTLKRRSER